MACRLIRWRYPNTRSKIRSTDRRCSAGSIAASSSARLDHSRDVRIGVQVFAERPPLRRTQLGPRRHRAALHDTVGVLAQDARLGQRQQHFARVHHAAQAFQVGQHPPRIDQQLLHHPRQPHQREIQRHRRIRTDRALHGGVADVAFMPQRHVLQRRHHGGTDDPGEAAQVLAQHRVPLVRHRRGTLLAGMEEFFRLPHLGALQVAHFGGQPLDGAGDDAESAEERRVAVARDDLGGDRLRPSVPVFPPRIPRRCGSRWANVPTAPLMAATATSARAATRRSRLRANSA